MAGVKQSRDENQLIDTQPTSTAPSTTSMNPLRTPHCATTAPTQPSESLTICRPHNLTLAARSVTAPREEFRSPTAALSGGVGRPGGWSVGVGGGGVDGSPEAVPCGRGQACYRVESASRQGSLPMARGRPLNGRDRRPTPGGDNSTNVAHQRPTDERAVIKPHRFAQCEPDRRSIGRSSGDLKALAR